MHPQGVYYLVQQQRKRQEERRCSLIKQKEALDNPPPLIRTQAVDVIPNDKMTPRKNPVIQRKSQLYPAAKALFNQRRRPSIEEKPELSTVAQEESPDDT